MSELSRSALAYRIFFELLDLPAPGHELFLQDRCRGDEALRGDVEALLRLSQADVAHTTDLRGAPPALNESLIGETFGRFRLVERVGEGGMGVVYRAERTDGVRQSVAIKLVMSTLAGVAQQRFEHEAQMLARLEHPAIARLIDVGIAESRPWIAMEFVRGERIDRYCAAQGRSAREIVALLILLTDAVSAAHRMLIVHSDIKPANVLVNADGLPKLVDFGISYALRDAGAEVNAGGVDALALVAHRAFSPSYSAPEQISGASLTVATDVFGLGALAYRLLTGVPPYAEASEPFSYLLAIKESEAELASCAAQSHGRPEREVRALRGDLDAVLAKALRRNPAQRYATAADMQADLKRYLENRPVAARVTSTGYRLHKLLQRNALASGLVGLLMLSLLVGGVAAAIQGKRAALQEKQAATARNMAARRGEFLENLIKSADPRTGRRDTSVAELLDGAAAILDEKLGAEPLVEASMLGLIADTNDGLGRYPQALAASDRQMALLKAEGGGALDLGRALTSRAEVLRELGEWAPAESAGREAVALLRPLHAPVDFVAALNIFGIALEHNHHEAEAEATFLEEIAEESKGGPQLKRQLSQPYYALGALYLNAGKDEQGLAYERKALDLAHLTLPPWHPDLLAMQVQYASALVTGHRAAEAEPLLRDAIAQDTRVSGPNHKDTLNTEWVLADDLIELHRDAEAAAIALPAAQGLEALLGVDNTYALTAWQVYAIAECNSQHAEVGLPIARRVEAARRRLVAPTDRLLHMASSALGLCLLRSHLYGEAEPVLLTAAAGLEAARGPSYRRTQDAYRSLYELYLVTGRPQVASNYQAKLRP